MLAREKHSSLLQKLVNYRQKSFITLGPELKMHIALLNTDNIYNVELKNKVPYLSPKLPTAKFKKLKSASLLNCTF
jgi:hypothetical protein